MGKCHHAELDVNDHLKLKRAKALGVEIKDYSAVHKDFFDVLEKVKHEIEEETLIYGAAYPKMTLVKHNGVP